MDLQRVQQCGSNTVSSILKDLYDFVFFSQKEGECYKFSLNLMYPRKDLSDVQQTLAEAGIDDMTQIVVTKL